MKRGFTIMEMVAVICIISLMAVIAISATSYSGAGASSKQGAVMASNLFALARSEAIEKQGYVVFVIDANPDTSHPGNFLHRMMVTDGASVPDSAGNNTVTQVTTWYQLPSGVYFDPAWSTPNGTVPITVNGGSGQIFNGPAYVYTFTPDGQMASAGQLIFSVGHESSPDAVPVFEDGTGGTPDTRQGFYLRLLGRPSFFLSPNSITSTSH